MFSLCLFCVLGPRWLLGGPREQETYYLDETDRSARSRGLGKSQTEELRGWKNQIWPAMPTALEECPICPPTHPTLPGKNIAVRDLPDMPAMTNPVVGRLSLL